MPATYVEANDKAESLSDGGGQKWTLVTTDATVAAATSGDLVIYGEMVGIALEDYNYDTGSVTLDLTGGHAIEVHAVDAADANVVVYVGEWLYWDEAAQEVNRDSTNGVPIGTALEAMTTGATADIGVKFWPVPPTYA